MTSRSAACVFGEARLTSSASTMFPNTAPGRNSNSRVRSSQTCTPVTSVGSRSGVNWIRRIVPSMEFATALAREVLPTPGTSSMSRWPSAAMHTRARRMTSRLPRTKSSTLRTSSSYRSANHSTSDTLAEGSVMGFSPQESQGKGHGRGHPGRGERTERAELSAPSGARTVPAGNDLRPVCPGGSNRRMVGSFHIVRSWVGR